MVDPGKLEGQIADMLRVGGALELVESQQVVVAAGIDPARMVSVGNLEALSVSQSASIAMSDDPVRTVPDEAVTISALSNGAQEAGEDLASILLDLLRARR